MPMWLAGPVEFSGPELFIIFFAVIVVPVVVIGIVGFVIFKVVRQVLRDRSEPKGRDDGH